MVKPIDYTPRVLSADEVEELNNLMHCYQKELARTECAVPFDNNKYAKLEMGYYDLLKFILSCENLTMAQFKKDRYE